jgi:4-amino-4-deoxychorismate lyase
MPAATPILRADDLGVLRGDGIFETVHVREGEPWLLAEHLKRMAASAARLDLALPPAHELADLAAEVCAHWGRQEEGVLRLVCTRGVEEGGPVTVYAVASGVSAALRRARAEGVRVITATLGFSTGVRGKAPWLLGGAKTLSYAVNMASLRWASAQGADDMLWVSTDGYALEAPTSSLAWLSGDVVSTVPVEETGILPGVTIRYLLDHAHEIGLGAEERMIRPGQLSTMDGVWLVSSVRGPSEVRAIDGQELPPSPHTGPLRKLLGF